MRMDVRMWYALHVRSKRGRRGMSMKRYTNRLDDGQAIMNCQDCDTDWTNKHAPKCTVMHCRNRLKDRVAAYEDTGLEPQEIERIVDTYGPEAQTLMVFEEMAELQKELCKHARGAYNREAIAEEIADVQIMLEQMIELHGCEDAVLCYKRHKLERLVERIEKAREADSPEPVHGE